MIGFGRVSFLGIFEFPRIRAQATEGIMAVKVQDTELTHPEAVADLQGLGNRRLRSVLALSTSATTLWRSIGARAAWFAVASSRGQSRL